MWHMAGALYTKSPVTSLRIELSNQRVASPVISDIQNTIRSDVTSDLLYSARAAHLERTRNWVALLLIISL